MSATSTNFKLPRLESGEFPSKMLRDRLTRHEFERRYAAMPKLKKAEFIEAVVYVASPVRISHGRLHARIIGWLGTYYAATPAVD
jgi:hypothetical protein